MSGAAQQSAVRFPLAGQSSQAVDGKVLPYKLPVIYGPPLCVFMCERVREIKCVCECV